LWRPGNSGPEVLLIHRPRYDDWTFPKGKAEPGEHPLLTAVREVREETGIRPVLGRPLPSVRYQRKGRPKRVDYWAATSAAGPVGDPAPAEVDVAGWLPLAAARERLTYQHDLALLTELTAGPGDATGPGTVPFVLLRHATAEPKRGWPGDDLLRPLDPPGREQAGAVAALLACFGAARVVSSATARCVDTVLPYAVPAGVPVRAEPALTIGGPVQAAEDRLRELLAEGVPTIFCGHGETLPGQLAALCGQLGAGPPPDPELEKGSFWVLHVRERTGGGCALAAIERHDS
jgi:8-oxo-(d)GTP phosphatase